MGVASPCKSGEQGGPVERMTRSAAQRAWAAGVQFLGETRCYASWPEEHEVTKGSGSERIEAAAFLPADRPGYWRLKFGSRGREFGARGARLGVHGSEDFDLGAGTHTHGHLSVS